MRMLNTFNLNRIFKLGIHRKLLIAFLALSTVPVLLAGLYAIHVYTQSLQEKELEHLEHDVMTVQERTATFLNGVESDIRFLDASYLFRAFLRDRNDVEATDAFINQTLNFARSKGIYYQIRYFDEEADERVKIRLESGTYAAYINAGEPGGLYYRYLTEDLQRGDLTLVPVELKDSQGGYVAALSYVLPVFAGPRGRKGMLVMDVFAEQLFRIIEEAHANIGGKVALVSDEGYYLYHPEKKRNWSQLLVARDEYNIYRDYPPGAVKRILSGEPDVWVGARDVMACAPLLQNVARDLTSYILCMSVPRTQILASVIRFERVFYTLLAVFVVLSIGLAYLAAAHFTRPINALQTEAAVIAGGQYGRRLQVETYDETQRLAETFNAMAQAVQEREIRIRQHEVELEAMVAARTKELEEEKLKLQAILDNVPSAFVMLDHELRVLSVSRSFERISGYAPKEVIGQLYSRFFPDCQSGGERCPAEKTLRTRRITTAIQRFQDPVQQKARYLERMAIPVIQDGTMECIIEVVTDVTERKEMENRIIHSEKLATTGEMAAVIAHEMRNSLTSVKMILQLEQERDDLADADKEALIVATQSIQRMEDVVTDLLKFARPSPPSFQSQSVNAILRESLALVQHQIRRKGLRLSEYLAPDLPNVQGDPDQLKEVFVNLLLNAAQAAPEQGDVLVATRTHAGEGWVEVVVADSGPGIPEEYLERIFDPFFTTKPEGTGLGLSMVRRSVEAHGGTITGVNRPEGGARFTVRLSVDRVGLAETGGA